MQFPGESIERKLTKLASVVDKGNALERNKAERDGLLLAQGTTKTANQLCSGLVHVLALTDMVDHYKTFHCKATAKNNSDKPTKECQGAFRT